jgi:uncharacterized C2H2 Zn-finger protein/energy-coupling factor transporter ATP-binding protein EcfA2
MDKHILTHHPEWREKWYGEQDREVGYSIAIWECEWCGQTFEEGTDYSKHARSAHPKEVAELEKKGEQGQPDPSQQLNPTMQQDVTPFTQQQYMPTATESIVPQHQLQPQRPMKEEEDLARVELELDKRLGEEGTDIDEIIEEKSRALDVCPLDCCPENCECGDCDLCLPENEVDESEGGNYEEAPVGDPREREKDKEPKELSPEAQKIAGTDPSSVEAKSKAMPKLEVDVSDKITVLGKTGSGKTNLIKVLISDILPDYKFILLDSLGNYSEYEGQANVEYHLVNPTNTEDVDEIIYAALEAGDCMVVVDEVDRYQAKKGTMLNELVNLGRNYGVGGIFAARRTAAVDKDILANSPYIFTFQHILPQDLDVLITWFAQPEETFRSLQEYEAILFKDGEQVWAGKVPEKPTTKPTKKPTPPKKPKGKSKDKDKEPEDKEKGKEPETPETEKEPEPEKPPEEPTEEPPEEEPTEEPEEKSEEGGGMDCPVCGATFDDVDEYFTHMKGHAKPSWDGSVGNSCGEGKSEEGAFKCDQCGQPFKYQRDFLDHVSTHAR